MTALLKCTHLRISRAYKCRAFLHRSCRKKRECIHVRIIYINFKCLQAVEWWIVLQSNANNLQ